eukprot:Opistho-2@70989
MLSLLHGPRALCLRPLQVHAWSAANGPLSPPHQRYAGGVATNVYVDAAQPMMPFEEYRRVKRRLTIQQRVAGVLSGVSGTLASQFAFVGMYPHYFDPNTPPDQIQPIMGLDPIVVGVIGCLGGGVVSFGLGAFLAGSLWRLFNRQTATALAVRDADFFDRIARNRAPFFRPGDDYYGEKIKTAAEYRAWLKLQKKKKDPTTDVTESPFDRPSTFQ